MLSIRQLPETLINQIAAGEVVERPAAALRELVENALDAGASDIRITLENGGIGLIQVADDGSGMGPDDLQLSVQRHATSKLPDGDLHNIRSMGFRGEALPSIGAVARLHIVTCTNGAAHAEKNHGHEIAVEGGHMSAIKPAPRARGTTVTVRDLFYATPARLKFLKTPAAEYRACLDTVERLAMAFPHVAFHVTHNGKPVLRCPACPDPSPVAALRDRAAHIMAAGFLDAHLLLETDDLFGLISPPTYTTGVATTPYLFVNQRPIRDRALAQMIRLAYQDAIPQGRHPVAVLHLLLPPDQVDMNVHPTKAEVRFRDQTAIRDRVRQTLKHRLAQAHVRAAGAVPQRPTFAAPRETAERGSALDEVAPLFHAPAARPVRFGPSQLAEMAQQGFTSPDQRHDTGAQPLGMPFVQLFDTYIVSLSETGLVLVDQHAAHERLVYEQLKTALHDDHIETQGLLFPDVIDLPSRDKEALLQQQAALARLGVLFDDFGERAVILNAVPALGRDFDWPQIVRDLAALAAEDNYAGDFVARQLDRICATLACYGSVRAGRRLNMAEMGALLRQMEATPGSLTCNHGRPTAITLDRVQFEKLFARR